MNQISNDIFCDIHADVCVPVHVYLHNFIASQTHEIDGIHIFEPEKWEDTRKKIKTILQLTE